MSYFETFYPVFLVFRHFIASLLLIFLRNAPVSCQLSAETVPSFSQNRGVFLETSRRDLGHIDRRFSLNRLTICPIPRGEVA